MDIQAYLRRITYHGSLDRTSETLRDLQVAHLLTVPFENLSIHAGEPIVLDDQALFDKIVVRRRGGFCYEANGVFAALLRALGFSVTMLSARVANAKGEFGPDFDHMALMVELEKRWLVDVGFGDSFSEPLLLDERGDQVQGERAYRIESEGSSLILMQRDFDGEWKAQYRFKLARFEYSDFAEMCAYHQTSPESPFTQRRVCSRATSEGRLTLSDMRFITTAPTGEKEERLLKDQQEYTAVLREQFGVSI